MDSQFRLKNESLFVLAEAPGGVYNAEQLRVVCDIVKSSSSFMKLTSEQSLGLMVEPEGIPALQAQLSKVGMLLKPYRMPQTLSAKSCLGSLCPHAEQDALGDAINLSETLSGDSGLSRLMVGITLNGCSRSCVAGATEDIHLIAEETGYKISVGGRNAELAQLGQLVAENVASDALSDVVGRILALYTKERQDEESLFDTIERTGIGIFVEAAAGEVPDPVDLMTELPQGEETAAADNSFADNSFADNSFADNSFADNSFADMTLPPPDLGVERESALDVETGVDAEPAVDLEHASEFQAAEPSFSFDLPSESPPELSGASLFAGLPKAGQYDERGLEVHPVDEPQPSISDIPLDSFDDEFANNDDLAAQGLGSDAARFAKAMTDLEMPLASAASAAISSDGDDALNAQQVNALLADEGSLDLSEATDDDLNRVTQSIRSEAGFERDFERLSTETAKPYSPERHLAPVPKPVPAAAPAAPAAPAANASGGVGRFRVRSSNGQLELNLPTGLELQIPLEAFSEDAPFEMETEDGVVSIERTGNVLKVRFGGLCMGVPMKFAA